MTWRLVTDIDGHWDAVLPLLEPALAECHGEFDAEQLKIMLNKRKMSLLVYDVSDKSSSAACVFEVVHYPGKTVLRIVLLAGSAENGAVSAWMEQVEPFGRQLGATEMEAWCGDAQARHFRRWGMQKRYNIVTKELNHGT